MLLALTAGCAKKRIYTTPPGTEDAMEMTVPGGSAAGDEAAQPTPAPAETAGQDAAVVSEDLPEPAPAAAPMTTAKPAAQPAAAAPAQAPAPTKAPSPARAAETPAAPAPAPVSVPAAAAPAPAPATTAAVQPEAAEDVRNAVYDERGLAAWITPDSEDLPTASGDLYDPDALTAAHRTLPLGSTARVTNLENGLSVTVRINDRGPFNKDRIIDLSQAAAEAIGIKAQGAAEVGLSLEGGPAKAAKPKATAAPATAAKPQPAPAPAPSQAQAPAPAQAAETTPAAAPQAPQASQAPAPAAAVQAVSGGYWVQVGAFADKANAQRALEALVQEGYVQSRMVIAPGGGLFRVQAGAFPGEADAQSALARLKATYPASFLVRD
ncbi:MAG: septal ring lytic transglycosylase RlpA family protein [Desulfovibrionaceae bacterium]